MKLKFYLPNVCTALSLPFQTNIISISCDHKRGAFTFFGKMKGKLCFQCAGPCNVCNKYSLYVLVLVSSSDLMTIKKKKKSIELSPTVNMLNLGQEVKMAPLRKE